MEWVQIRLNLLFMPSLLLFALGGYFSLSKRFMFDKVNARRIDYSRSTKFLKVAISQVISLLLVFLLTQNLTLALPLGVILGYLPTIYSKNRFSRESEERRKSWPLVIDQLASATSSGVALHHALSEMAHRGPNSLKGDFLTFRESFIAEGSLERGLNDFVEGAIRNPLNNGDETPRRLRSTILVVRDCGGQEVGPILRNLGNFLRQRERILDEIAIKQTWIKNGAALASLAPWLLLLMFSFHSPTVAAYRNIGGQVVLASGLACTFVAYRWISRISDSISPNRNH